MDKENNVGNYLRFCHHSSEYQASPWGETSWTMTLNVRTVNVIPAMVPYLALLWDSTFIRVLFLRFYVPHGKSFLPSSRAHSLKIKEKTPDPRLGYLTLYLGIVACPQRLSRFSKKYWGETVFRDTQREKNNCHRNTQISSVGHFRTSHPLEFPSQWGLSYPAAPPPAPRISAIFSGSDPGIQAGSPGIPKTLKQYEKRYPNQSDIAILENEKTLETRLSQRC